jgi:hypothetical protein
MQEIFKDIPKYEGIYQVSNIGNVKSLPKNVKMPNGGIRVQKEKILKPSKDGSGYYQVDLLKNGNRKNIKIHQLVAMAFLDHKPDGTTKIVIDHINNIKTDNRIENLQLISHRENCSKDKKGGSSQYVGVYWAKNANKWAARIRINGKNPHLGYFTNELLASEAYQNTLKQLNG